MLIDLSWIPTDRLDRYDQDDLICLDVSIQPDGTLQGLSISTACGEPEPPKRTDDDQDPSQYPPTATPTATWTPIATFTPTATATFTPTGTLSPTATSTSTSTPTPTSTATATATATSTLTPTPVVADLSVTKSAVLITCTTTSCTMTFAVTVRNDGPGTATNVVVQEFAPSIGACTGTTVKGTFTSATKTWAVGTLTSLESAALALSCTGDNTLFTSFTNTAEVTASDQHDPDSTPNNHLASEDDQASATFTLDADLELSKSGTSIACSTLTATCTVTWSVTVENKGPGLTTNVVVQDFPTGFTVTSGTTATGSYVVATNLWSVGTLLPGQSATLTVVGSGSNTTTTFTNTAEVTVSTQHDPDSTPNNHVASEDDQATATLQRPNADLRVLKAGAFANCGPPAGSCATFQIQVTNLGPDPATNVTIQDTPVTSPVLTAPAPVPSKGSYNAATDVWTIGPLAFNETATLTVALDLVSGEANNCASVLTSDQFDTDTTNNMACDDVVISSEQLPDEPGPDLGWAISPTLLVADARRR